MGRQLVQAEGPRFGGQILQKAEFAFAHDLHPVVVEIIEIAAQGQAGAVDVAGIHQDFLRRGGHIDGFQHGFLDDTGQGDGKGFRHRASRLFVYSGWVRIYIEYYIVLYRIRKKL